MTWDDYEELERLRREADELRRENNALRALAADAWRELEALGPDEVFLYGHLKKCAKALGVVP
jgi:hypothetical protein